jgi:hypothetical protein
MQLDRLQNEKLIYVTRITEADKEIISLRVNFK